MSKTPKTCDTRMLRYMARTRWRDHLSNEALASLCGVGQVNRRDEDNPVNVARKMEVPGRRPVGRPKMTWQKGN